MRIDINRPYSECIDACTALKPDGLEQLKQAAQDHIGAYWDLTLGVYFRLCDGDLSVLGFGEKETVAQHYWLEGLKGFGEELAKITRRLEMPKNLLRPYEEQARSICLKLDAKESILVFVQRYFGLPSFRACEDITLAEYIIARRADYNENVMRRRAEQLQQQAINKRQKK